MASLCNGFVAMAFLQWLRCNVFRVSRLPMFTNKAIIFLGKNIIKDFQANENAALAV